MPYAAAVVERTMKVQEVMLQALSGKLTWPQAEEILGWSPRTVRRWRVGYAPWGYGGLLGRRASSRRAEEILGSSPRTVRRWRLRYARWGYDGLWDRRRQLPSPRRVPVAEI